MQHKNPEKEHATCNSDKNDTCLDIDDAIEEEEDLDGFFASLE